MLRLEKRTKQNLVEDFLATLFKASCHAFKCKTITQHKSLKPKIHKKRLSI